MSELSPVQPIEDLSVSGVAHGPYPKTDNHPWDQSVGLHDAIEAAADAGRITEEQSERLMHNIGPVHEQAYYDEQELHGQVSGVAHGPYPKTEAHPWDQANGVHEAITEAESTGRITAEHAEELHDNALELDVAANHDEQGMTESHFQMSDHGEYVTLTEAQITEKYPGLSGAELQRAVEKDYFAEEQAKQDAYDVEFDKYNAEQRGYDPSEEDENTEDPLAGDVDKFVHPDETRSDEQIAHDEKYKVEPY